MADFNSVFNYENDNLINNNLDFFFTQRKIVEYKEEIDKNMKRVKSKKNITYNFLALNLPIFSNEDKNLDIKIEMWGDKGYNYKGGLNKSEGTFPHLLIKLLGDTQLFVKLVICNNNERKNFVNFIQIPKRYQSVPDLKVNEKKLDVNDK
jgi:hypothetical protein